MRRAVMLSIISVMALVAAACGADDGGEVRNLGGSAGSASASGSGSASGVASGSGSASGAAGGEASGDLGGYVPVSDVSAHARVTLDICDINELLPSDGPIDYAAIEAIYEEGVHSVNADGSVRTIAGFARSERDEDIWNLYVDHYGDPTWLDTFVTSAIEGSGPFEGESDAVRRQGIQKGIQNQIMIAWALHELVAALEKAEAGEFAPASGAPHNWDEGWAFYHGEAPQCAPYATADSRGENFGIGSAVNDALLAQFTRGVEALVAEDAAVAAEAKNEIVRQMTITYLQATIRYANKIDDALAGGDAGSARISQAEGWAFFRVIEPMVAEVDAAAAAVISERFDLAAQPSEGTGPAVEEAFDSVYSGLGISRAEIGQLSG